MFLYQLFCYDYQNCSKIIPSDDEYYDTIATHLLYILLMYLRTAIDDWYFNQNSTNVKIGKMYKMNLRQIFCYYKMFIGLKK